MSSKNRRNMGTSLCPSAAARRENRDRFYFLRDPDSVRLFLPKSSARFSDVFGVTGPSKQLRHRGASNPYAKYEPLMAQISKTHGPAFRQGKYGLCPRNNRDPMARICAGPHRSCTEPAENYPGNGRSPAHAAAGEPFSRKILEHRFGRAYTFVSFSEEGVFGGKHLAPEQSPRE